MDSGAHQPRYKRKCVVRVKVRFWPYCVFILKQLMQFNYSKKREVVPDLAPMLWHSFGTTAALLQEIINIYPAINPATLTAYQSNRYVLIF